MTPAQPQEITHPQPEPKKVKPINTDKHRVILPPPPDPLKYKRWLKSALRIIALLVLLLLILGYWLRQPVFSSASPLNLVVSTSQLTSHIDFLSVDCHPRNLYQTANLNRAADYIQQQFTQTNAVVTRQPYAIGEYHTANISAIFPGVSTERIIVGAHYDSAGPTPGADDNASAVAALIEIAKLLDGQKLQRTVELVAYSSEEPPSFGSPDMGSAKHAKALVNQKIPVKCMLCLEMLGYYSDKLFSQSYPIGLLYIFYPTKGNYLSVVGRTADTALTCSVKAAMNGATPLPVYSVNLPESFSFAGIDFSDHRNYWAHNINAVMITDTSFFRNPHYHKKTDTRQTLDLQRLSFATVAIYNAISQLTSQP